MTPTGIWQNCCRCKTDMWLPAALDDAARRSPSIFFSCPYGHTQHYAEGESNETKLRHERDRLAQQIAQRDDEIRELRDGWNEAEKRAAAANIKAAKFLKRATAGVCPCCNRSFSALQRHMATQHPQYSAAIVSLEKKA